MSPSHTHERDKGSTCLLKASSLNQVSLARNYDVLKASTEANGNCSRAALVSPSYGWTAE